MLVHVKSTRSWEFDKERRLIRYDQRMASEDYSYEKNKIIVERTQGIYEYALNEKGLIASYKMKYEDGYGNFTYDVNSNLTDVEISDMGKISTTKHTYDSKNRVRKSTYTTGDYVQEYIISYKGTIDELNVTVSKKEEEANSTTYIYKNGLLLNYYKVKGDNLISNIKLDTYGNSLSFDIKYDNGEIESINRTIIYHEK